MNPDPARLRWKARHRRRRIRAYRRRMRQAAHVSTAFPEAGHRMTYAELNDALSKLGERAVHLFFTQENPMYARLRGLK